MAQPANRNTANNRLTTSNWFRSGRHAQLFAGRRDNDLLIYICLALFALIWSTPAQALDPSRLLTQYGHRAWRVGDAGLMSSLKVVTQTRDGELWVGGDNGLYRFNGQTFSRWHAPLDLPVAGNEIRSLFATPAGDLFAGGPEGLSRVSQQGHVLNYSAELHDPGGFAEDARGVVWFTHLGKHTDASAFCAVAGQTLRCFGKKDGIDCIDNQSLAVGPQGDIWVAGEDGVCHWKSGGKPERYLPPGWLSGQSNVVFAVAIERDGSLLVGLGVGGLWNLAHGKWSRPAGMGPMAAQIDVQRLFHDANGALWIGTFSHGLFKLEGDILEHFDIADGLTGDAVFAISEDHEGSIWVATNHGLDQFFDLPVATYSRREGLGAEPTTGLVADDRGVWVAGGRALTQVQGRRVSSIDYTKIIGGGRASSIFEDESGRVWLGTDTKLATFGNGTFHVLKDQRGADVPFVYYFAQNPGQDVWTANLDVSTRPPHGVLRRFHDGKVIETIESPTIEGRPRAFNGIAADGAGGLWVIIWQHGVYRRIEGLWKRVEAVDAHTTATGLAPDGPGKVWIASLNGLIWLDQNRARSITPTDGLPCAKAYAVLLSKSGDLWVETQCGLVEIARAELIRWQSKPGHKIHPKLMGPAQGFEAAMGASPPSESSDGRLWFNGDEDLREINPARLPENKLAPPIVIERLVADRTNYSPDAHVILPEQTRQIEVDYAGLSFVHPEFLKFSYRLVGYDPQWREVGARRQAFYDGLPPASYHFEVKACNEDAVCNAVPATLDFRLPPAWYQTLWFKVTNILAGVIILTSIILWRVNSYAQRMKLRFDERLRERTRVARDLHDTLMQTVLASKFMADDARRHPNDPAHLRTVIGQLSDWLSRAAEEGRAAIDALRSSAAETNDLADAFVLIANEACQDRRPDIQVSVVGRIREMHPIVRGEIYRIGSEAIRNACVHAQAHRVEIHLSYRQVLSLRIKDDGQGIPKTYLEEGKPQHFGLAGMRERAKTIGAKLEIISSPLGTTILLIVPGWSIYTQGAGLIDRFLRCIRAT